MPPLHEIAHLAHVELYGYEPGGNPIELCNVGASPVAEAL